MKTPYNPVVSCRRLFASYTLPACFFPVWPAFQALTLVVSQYLRPQCSLYIYSCLGIAFCMDPYRQNPGGPRIQSLAYNLYWRRELYYLLARLRLGIEESYTSVYRLRFHLDVFDFRYTKGTKRFDRYDANTG